MISTSPSREADIGGVTTDEGRYVYIGIGLSERVAGRVCQNFHKILADVVVRQGDLNRTVGGEFNRGSVHIGPAWVFRISRGVRIQEVGFSEMTATGMIGILCRKNVKGDGSTGLDALIA